MKLTGLNKEPLNLMGPTPMNIKINFHIFQNINTYIVEDFLRYTLIIANYNDNLHLIIIKYFFNNSTNQRKIFNIFLLFHITYDITYK